MEATQHDAAVQRARRLIAEADALLFTAGAGMGVDSNLGTFRDAASAHSWAPLATREHLDWADVSQSEWFEAGNADEEIAGNMTDEQRVRFAWSFWHWRWSSYSGNEPHRGYHLLLDAGRGKKGGYFVYTSNIDGHFIAAGAPQERVCEIHGSVHYLQCVRGEKCSQPNTVWEAEPVLRAMKLNEQGDALVSELPRCPHCGDLARPNVLMFSDMRQVDPRYDVPAKNYGAWLDQLAERRQKLLIVEVGCGVAIPDVRTHAEWLVEKMPQLRNIVRINPHDLEWDVLRGKVAAEQVAISGGALETLELLFQ